MAKDVREQEQNQGQQPGSLSAEAQADLAALDAQAEKLTGGEPGPGEAVQVGGEAGATGPVPSVDLAEEIAGLLEVVIGMLSIPMPALETIWTPDKIKLAAGRTAAVCNKRGWLQGGITGGYAEEIALLMTVGPMLMASYKVYKETKAEADKAIQAARDGARADAAGNVFTQAGEAVAA